MKKKKRGFVATSLIYSFFLVFLAVLAGLIRNYVANKLVLERFNENAASVLNTNKYRITSMKKLPIGGLQSEKSQQSKTDCRRD